MKHGDFDQDAGEMEMGTCVMDHDREKSDHDLALATSVRPVNEVFGPNSGSCLHCNRQLWILDFLGLS